MNEKTPTPLFQNLLHGRSNANPEVWDKFGKLLDQFAFLLKGNLVPNLKQTVQSAEEASSILFCALMTIKRSNSEMGLSRLLGTTSGKSTSSKLIRWVVNQLESPISAELRVAWGGLHQQMSSTIEMMIRELEVVGDGVTPETGVAWIRKHGGMGILHMNYMRVRQMETMAEKARITKEREAGAKAIREKTAKDAGFETVEEYDTHMAQVAQQRQKETLRSKFTEVREALITNGKPTKRPGNGQLLIASAGRLIRLSEADEFALLSCAASVL